MAVRGRGGKKQKKKTNPSSPVDASAGTIYDRRVICEEVCYFFGICVCA